MTLKKVVITGAGGFIGSNLWRYLANLDYQVIACLKTQPSFPIPRNSHTYFFSLPNPELDNLLNDEKPDFLVHCAGGASVAKSISDPYEDFKNNVLVTEALLNSIAKKSPLTKMIFLSSAAVYGNPVAMPIDETTPVQPISPYGYHKLICELLCEKYHLLFRIPITILRIFSVYGPGLKKQLFWDIYQKAMYQPIVSLHGTGNETRDFLYIDDLVKIVEKLLNQSDFSCDKLNIASGIETKIKSIADFMLKAMDNTKPLYFTNQTKAGDPLYWSTDIKSIQNLGPMNPLSIETGVKQYVKWIFLEENQK